MFSAPLNILELEPQGKQYLGSCQDLQVRPKHGNNAGWGIRGGGLWEGMGYKDKKRI